VDDRDGSNIPAGAEATRLDFDEPSTAARALADADQVFLMRPPAVTHVRTKLLHVPISTYLMVLAKIRRPAATPSARTSRSLIRRDPTAKQLDTTAGSSWV
jgi:hypothetical protein